MGPWKRIFQRLLKINVSKTELPATTDHTIQNHRLLWDTAQIEIDGESDPVHGFIKAKNITRSFL